MDTENIFCTFSKSIWYVAFDSLRCFITPWMHINILSYVNVQRIQQELYLIHAK
jgi:hypothetical protein